ncbi:hypothetical protein [Neolewinella aurantiaca]|uniref:hypothetical protein n=1 Tax=Neolewinella aurantiaca TaxID=2602767 RepID=UPI0016503C76|nr:hypothetical protein [Neolewinella aurantiaca]
MPDSPLSSELKALVNSLNRRDGNIKVRRARIDTIIDDDFAVLSPVYQQLAK